MFLPCETKILSSKDAAIMTESTKFYYSFLEALRAASKMIRGGNVIKVIDAEQDAFVGFIVEPIQK